MLHIIFMYIMFKQVYGIGHVMIIEGALSSLFLIEFI